MVIHYTELHHQAIKPSHLIELVECKSSLYTGSSKSMMENRKRLSLKSCFFMATSLPSSRLGDISYFIKAYQWFKVLNNMFWIDNGYTIVVGKSVHN